MKATLLNLCEINNPQGCCCFGAVEFNYGSGYFSVVFMPAGDKDLEQYYW